MWQHRNYECLASIRNAQSKISCSYDFIFFNTGLYCVRHTKDLQGGDIKLCMNSDGQEISGAV